MRELVLLRGQVALVDEMDFPAVSGHRWYLNGGYPVARIDGRPTCLHAFLLGRAPTGHHIDHINRNRLDNRRENLRVVTAAENVRNRRSYKGRANPFFGRKHSSSTKAANAARCGRPVIQVTSAGEVVRKFPSAMEAQRALGISNVSITEVANGRRKTAGGFQWRRP